MNKKLDKKLFEMYDKNIKTINETDNSYSYNSSVARHQNEWISEIVQLNNDDYFDQEKKVHSSNMECDRCGDVEHIADLFLNTDDREMYCYKCINKRYYGDQYLACGRCDNMVREDRMFFSIPLKILVCGNCASTRATNEN